MKKILSLCITAVMLLAMAAFAVPAFAADAVFENPKDINIVYIGGSITQGGGATGWVNLTGEYFKKKFGESNVTIHNAGVGGTGSDYGLLRFKRDVVDKNPDMVFIEFAVNDAGADTTRYLESMVLTLQKLEKVPYICFAYTTNQSLNVNQTYQRAIADYYGLAQIDFQARMKEETTKNPAKPMSSYLNDSVHPNADGYAVYTDEVIKCLETGKYYTKPQVKDKKYNSKSMFVNTTFTPVKDYVTTKGWQDVAGSYVTTSENTSAIGQKIHFEFTGNIFAVEHRLHFNGGMYSVIIDGRNMGTVSDYYKDIQGQLVLGYVNYDLGQGKHTVDIEVVESQSSGSGGHMVGFYNFITDEDPDFDTTKIDQNFNDGDNTAIASIGATPEAVWDWDGTCGVDGSGGLKVTTGTGTYGSGTGVPFNVDGLEVGRTYKASAKIKLDSVEKIGVDNVVFTFRLPGLNEDGTSSGKNAFYKVTAENVGLNHTEFVLAEAEFVFTGEGVLSSNKATLCDGDGTFEVRVGSDKLEEVTGDRNQPLTYYIDDITMIPGEKAAENDAPAAPSEIQILVNDVKVEADVPPVIVDGRTLVPVRAIFEALGANVEWIAETRTAKAVRGEDTIEIQIDNTIMLVNGAEVALDVPAMIVADRTMVPARAIAESFNLLVDWNGETRTVIITNK